MGMEIYLRMDGITGSVKSYTYKDWTEVRSWHWGMTRNKRMQGDSSVETVNMNRITVIKPVGVESPMLMTLFAERKIAASAEIKVAPPAVKRGAQLKFIDIALENVLIQSIETGANTGENELLETLVFAFAKVKYEFFHNTAAVQGGDAASTKSEIFTWDASARKSD